MQGWWGRSVSTGGVRGGHFPFFASLHSTQAGTRKEAESRGLQLRNHNISWSNHKSDSSYFCHTLLGRGGSSGPAHNQGEVMTEKHKCQPARMTEHSIRRCPSPGCPGKSLMWLLPSWASCSLHYTVSCDWVIHRKAGISQDCVLRVYVWKQNISWKLTEGILSF